MYRYALITDSIYYMKSIKFIENVFLLLKPWNFEAMTGYDSYYVGKLTKINAD